MHILFVVSLSLIGADFPICTATNNQVYPCAQFQNDQYYVFWADYRNYSPYYSLYGARIAQDGSVLDPDGKQLFMQQSAYEPAAAYDGNNFLVVFRDSC